MLTVPEALRHRVRAGGPVEAAPLLTDLPIVLAALFVLSRVSEIEPVVGSIFLCGGAFLCWLAYESLSFKGADVDNENASDKSLSKAIIANFLNPAPYLFWLTIGAPSVIKSYETGLLAAASFVAAFYFCLVGAKATLAFLVGRSRSFLKSGAYIVIIRILGFLLLGYACLFLYKGLEKLSIL